MSYDSNRPANIGDTKLSELAVDRTLPLFDSSGPQTNALIGLESAFRALTELARKSNYILRSEGQIQWNGTDIRFDAGAVVNSMNFEVLATEGSIDPAYQLRLQGSTSSNGVSTFKNIPMSDGDLLYMELDASELLDSGSSFDLENAVNGGGITAGYRVIRQSMSTALPKLTIGATDGGSLFYIPLALRRGTDILWIPHGIRWPAGTTSALGAIIVEGFDAYPERFVSNQTQLLSALSDLSALGGGVILVKEAFTIDQTINVPDNIKILGRGRKNPITLAVGASIVLQNRCYLEGLKLITAASWTGQAVQMNGTRNRVISLWLDLSASADSSSVKGVQVAGNGNRINDTSFTGVSTNRVGINYSSGTDNADIDCEFA